MSMDEMKFRNMQRDVARQVVGICSGRTECRVVQFEPKLSLPIRDDITENGYCLKIGKFVEHKIFLYFSTNQDGLSGEWHIWAGFHGQGESAREFIANLPESRQPVRDVDCGPLNAGLPEDLYGQVLQEVYSAGHIWIGIYDPTDFQKVFSHEQIVENAVEFYCDIFGQYAKTENLTLIERADETENAIAPVDSDSSVVPPQINDQRQVVELLATPTIAPPINDADEYLNRIKTSRGLPERNMEALVQELLVSLGHAPASVRFQIGHIDVLVNDELGKPYMVVEVKRSLRSKPDRDSALRQAFDYSNRNGAPIVVITDADMYEVYDRNLGFDHASMLRAKFQLTSFLERDVPGLDALRPLNG